jgi:hypothetical protein
MAAISKAAAPMLDYARMITAFRCVAVTHRLVCDRPLLRVQQQQSRYFPGRGFASSGRLEDLRQVS